MGAEVGESRFHTKEIIDVSPVIGGCSYPECTNSGIHLVKHLLDGALEDEYLVCADHVKYERGLI